MKQIFVCDVFRPDVCLLLFLVFLLSVNLLMYNKSYSKYYKTFD